MLIISYVLFSPYPIKLRKCRECHNNFRMLRMSKRTRKECSFSGAHGITVDLQSDKGLSVVSSRLNWYRGTPFVDVPLALKKKGRGNGHREGRECAVNKVGAKISESRDSLYLVRKCGRGKQKPRWLSSEQKLPTFPQRTRIRRESPRELFVSFSHFASLQDGKAVDKSYGLQEREKN